MTLKKLTGMALIASPFIALFIFVSIEMNVLTAIGIYVVAAALVGIISLGVKLTEEV